MADFPELQGDAQNGKTKMWKIVVVERDTKGVIQTTFGYVDGKKQVNEKVISEGKNLGKKNETTPLQQAIQEARTAWIKKKESGYAPLQDEEKKEEEAGQEAGREAGQEEGGRGKGIDDTVPTPMLAHDYNKRGKNMKFPCYVQRKYDGTRCVAIPGKGLFSRNRKGYPHLSHIVDEINQLPPGYVLDGELYSDTLTFQEIVGIVKRETLQKGDAEKQLQIQYHVYDIINDKPYHERLSMLQTMFGAHPFRHIIPVKTDVCDSQEKMKELHDQYVAEGYEGIMLRNKNGPYKQVRSPDLQKYKCFEDAEYEVVDYKEGEGQEAGCVIWVCKTDEGKVFHCRPRGTREDRALQFQHGADFVGKKLTVRYQELTDTKLPRFPVGIAFRDYE